MEESHQNIEAYLKCNFEFALLSEMFSLSLISATLVSRL